MSKKKASQGIENTAGNGENIGTQDKVKKKKTGKKKTVLLCVLTVFLVVLAVFIIGIVIPNFGNIKAAFIWLTNSSEDIQGNLDEAKNKELDALKDAGLGHDKSVIEAFENGIITEEQFTKIGAKQMTLDEAISINEAVDAFGNGLIDGELFSRVCEKELTLDEAIEEYKNKSNVKEEQDAENLTDDEKEKGETSTDDKNATNTNEKSDTKPEGSGNIQQAVDAYKKGEITDKQLIQIGKNDITLENAIESNKTNTSQSQEKNNSQSTTQNTSSDKANVDEQISAQITKMYVLKGQYEGYVNSVINRMKAEYVKLPKEQQTTSAKSSIASGYISEINAMEAQCDAQVNAVISELRTILSKNGRDTALADTLLSTYSAEKENTKAYCLSKYGD